jgi:hypothetical protein
MPDSSLLQNGGDVLKQLRSELRHNRDLNRYQPYQESLTLWFRGKDRRVARDVFDLFHGDNGHFFGGIDLQDFHVVADGMADGVIDQQFLIIGKDDFYPIDHDGSSVKGIGVEVEMMAGSLLHWPDEGNRRVRKMIPIHGTGSSPPRLLTSVWLETVWLLTVRCRRWSYRRVK